MRWGDFMDKNKKTPSLNDYSGKTPDAFDMVNKYGTYEIQPTCDTDEEYPQIAQGLSAKKKRK